MSPRHRRYNLLLDEMLPRREKFPVLNNLHNLKHIVHDLKKSGAKDREVVRLAKRQNRIIITKNTKHFETLCREEKVDVLGVSEVASPEELDGSIMAHLRRKTSRVMTGLCKKITKIQHKKSW